MDQEEAMETGSFNGLPFGQGVSAFGSDAGDDEDDAIPQRIFSFDLTTGTVGHDDRYDVERAPSPATSFLSMESEDRNFDESENFDKEPFQTQVKLERRDSSASSYSSMDSDECMDGGSKRVDRKSRTSGRSADPPVKKELLRDPDEKRHPALTVEFTFKAIQSTLLKLAEGNLKAFKKNLWHRYLECFKDPLDNLDIVALVDKMLESCDLEGSLNITQLVLRDMNLKQVAEYLLGLLKRNEVRYELKQSLKRQYESIYEGLAKQGHQILFDSVFTELYITQGVNAAINCDHEVREIEELMDDRKGREKVVKCQDIFNPDVVEKKHIRSMVMKGFPGCGKSMAVQKFILDWAEGRAHQEMFFVLPLPFQKLNQMQGNKISFMELVHTLYPEMRDLETLDYEDCKVLFVCDGLDDFLEELDFRRTECWCDVKEPTSLRVLITNLIRGNMLHDAYLWIVSRPIAANVIPAERVHQLLEVRGFTDEQKEAYFRKKHVDQGLAERIIAHLKSSKTLYIMCHNPMFCWVASNVLQQAFQSKAPGMELPKALTQMYTNLMLTYMSLRAQKLQQPKTEEVVAADKEFLMKIGKLAFILLEKGQFRIQKTDWREHDLSGREAVIQAGICTEFYKEKFVMYQEKVHCFVHATMQEYIAALYVFLSFKNHGKNVVEHHKLPRMFREPTLVDLHKSAVEKALHSKNGNFDIFLRFLLGMSTETNQNLLRSFLSNVGGNAQVLEETVRHIRKKIKENHFPDRNNNLQQCLEELSPLI